MDLLEQSINNDLYNIINKIKVCDNANDFDSLAGIYELLKIIASANNIITDDYQDIIYHKYEEYDIDNIVERLNKKTISYMNRYYKMNRKFAAIVNDLKPIYNNMKKIPVYKKNISNKNAIDFALDLYKNYDNDMYTFLKEYIKYNKIFFIRDLPNAVNGCVIDGAEYIIPYVFIEESNNILDFITIVHEFIHIYFQNIEKNFTFDQQINRNLNNFREVYSNFIELIALNYLKENSYNKNDIYCYKIDYDNDMIEDLALFNQYLGKKRFKIKDLDIILNVEQYSYGKVLAYHFYEQYLNDKEKAKNNLYNFVIDNKDKNKRYLLNNHGLCQSEVFSSRILKKNIY